MLNSNTTTNAESTRANLIQDPWDLPSPAPVVSSSTLASIPVEKHPLPIIGPAGNPDALPLAPGNPHPEQSLLWDWLKLQTAQAKELRMQLQQALGLLYWLES